MTKTSQTKLQRTKIFSIYCTIRLLTFTREEICKAKSVIQNLIKVSCFIKVVQRNVKHLYRSKNNITTHCNLERRKRNPKLSKGGFTRGSCKSLEEAACKIRLSTYRLVSVYTRIVRAVCRNCLSCTLP